MFHTYILEVFIMPTYDYKCKGEVKRLIGAGAGPIFKGNGFYETDYKRASSKSTGSKTDSKSSSSDK